ncbi:conserved Plasmodium protein, unknown function [Plasmodium knowlesi strain H]|uniref:Uncharacterized protein n=3 Tax=Plasmodium knowlesi TaxID=5850 RepID=A0A5K1VF23_PLAKH|nr:conserved Plasmodium protein, unknown function [Plasmodium knowlesi strain H]OTN68597.1 Uncharacterized protein PKNOH_S02307200 [Plasmodium knowlesi]CAA9986573.1 conserved Plasmodium protein, unknown function [Plasmodium knowlesi strain H]SBO24155.1 conserved Plasmodium protein, unknown function [Plasmodium knowlesi strain H]SBO29286.1 conserved Plasmodium protein, unknown function [Plasmodium knowlesi strain H]VVS76047.1 conserved Plasmodium protein, unknown function [Plasmodium knowlesi s|eukprot:XP_002261114.1 hypothetical protein, conserved in Plasmodium species [Plasmodium knowlesi strain H]
MAPPTVFALVAYLSIPQLGSSNVVVHPSLTDFFVERIGEHIFTSFDNLISKRLASPSCSSSGDTSCHLVHAGAIGYADEQTDQDTEQKPIKRKTEKEVTYDEEDDEKYTYLHTTPFYSIPIEEKGSTDAESKKDEDNHSENKLMKNKNRKSIWMKGYHFLVNVYTSLIKKKEHTIKIEEKLSPSYFINSRRTNILGNRNQLNQSPTKYNFKGLFIGQHLNDAKNFSFLSPLSLAIDEIDFKKIFMQGWDVDFYSNYIFLDRSDSLGVGNKKKKEGAVSPEGDVTLGKEEKSTYLTGTATTPTSSRTDGWVGNIKSILDLSKGEKEEQPSSNNSRKDGRTDRTTPPQMNEAYEEEEEGKLPGKHVTPSTINKILNKLRIPSERSNYGRMIKATRGMRVGVCTRQSKEGSLLPSLLKKTLVSSISFRKNYKTKEKNRTDPPPFTCAFFHSISNSEILLFLDKITSPNGTTPEESDKTTWNEETRRGMNFFRNTMKLTNSTLYKKWSKRNNHNKGYTDIISTNPLKNLTVHANYEYKKNLFKLHSDYNGISRSIMVVRNYQKKVLLKFIFQVDICYNDLYVDNDIQMRYIYSDANPSLITRGAWSSCALWGPLHFYIDGDNRVDTQRGRELEEPVGVNSSGDTPPHESSQSETELRKIYWHEQILSDKVEPAQRYKRLKSLYVENPRLEEIRDRTYWMDRHVRDSGDILLLSTKGSIEFKTPIVVSDLYVRLHPNPLYRSSCVGEGGNAQETPLETCTQEKPYSMHVLFNFYLNKTKKYSAVMEIYVDTLGPGNHNRHYNVRHSSGYTKPLNVMTLLKGNINHYRVNKIEIEYSLNPHPLVQREGFIHRRRMPFLVSVCNLTINQSQKVYNYIPTFFVSKGNFLQVLSRIQSNPINTSETTIGTENITQVSTMNVFSTTNTERNHEGKSSKFISNTSFSIFTSLSEPIFWAHIIQFRCGVSQCQYDQATEQFLMTTLGGRHEGTTTQGSKEVTLQRHFFQPNAHITTAINGKNTKEGEYAELSEIQKAYLDFLDRWKPSEVQQQSEAQRPSERGQPSSRMSEADQTSYRNETQQATMPNTINEPRAPQHFSLHKKQIVAYDMTDILNLEHNKKRYMIPPYRKGIYICLESKRNQLVYDPNGHMFYVKENEKVNIGNDTRDALPALWIYSALLPTESDLLDFSFLTKNKFTLKMVQTNDTKVYFKNIIPLTRYEDYENIERNYTEKVLKISFIDFKENGFMSHPLGQTIDSQLYRAKVIEFLKSKFSTLVQFSSEDMDS